jgi:serine/threonine protein kinase
MNKKTGIADKLRHKLLGDKKKADSTKNDFHVELSDIKSVGRYEITGKIGEGSMGVVYRGRDPYIKRDVSIKITRPAGDLIGKEADKYRERFFVEAQSAGQLMHPNIVAIYDAGIFKDFCYMTMEYIDGNTLLKFCGKESLLPLNKIVEIIFTVCNALDYTHKKGIIHRDIKPSNIMLTKSGLVKITDFGIAKIRSEQIASKGIVGSPSYMSPEQIKENQLSNKSDIFSLGCVLYELLTGEKAFPGDNDYSIMYKILNQDPVPITGIRSDLPEILIKISQKALAKDPSQRYQTCGDLAYHLRVALRGLEGTSKSIEVEDVVNYLDNVPFFENFTKDQIKSILEASNIINIPKGEVIVSEGDIDDSFFVVLSGQAAVQKRNKKIAFIRRGECFGEMAFLSGQIRAATVSAETDCSLLKTSATLLDRAPEDMQLLFIKNFAITLVQRLTRSIQKESQ